MENYETLKSAVLKARLNYTIENTPEHNKANRPALVKAWLEFDARFKGCQGYLDLIDYLYSHGINTKYLINQEQNNVI